MADGQTPTPDKPEGAPAPDGGTGTPATPPTPTTEDKAPKWEGDFDPERAAKLVANLRSDMDKLKQERDELRRVQQEREDAEKSELEKAVARAERAEQALQTAERDKLRSAIAKKHELPDELVGFLDGDTEDDIEAKAKALAEFAAARRDPADDLSGKPKPRLVPGHGDDSDSAPFDPDAIAKAARSGR